MSATYFEMYILKVGLKNGWWDKCINGQVCDKSSMAICLLQISMVEKWISLLITSNFFCMFEKFTF